MRLRNLLLPGLFLLSACGGGSSGTTANVTGSGPTAGLESAAPNLSVQESPFRICFNKEVCTAEASTLPAPMPYQYSEGPRPQVNPQTATAFPAFGWVVGETRNEVIPSFIWQGNRLSGMDTGTLYEVTNVASVTEFDDRIEYALNTNYSDQPARLTLRGLPSGALEAHLEPPPGMAEEGIALTLFTIDSPEGEGLFGMGARKDFFNQRGKLRNVWTEQQNTGLGALDELDFTGVGSFGGSPVATTNPTADIFDQLGLNPDVDDALLAEDRTTFPNGAQAAYWVEAFVVGARGWGLWTSDMYFQRLDLAATRPDKIRWQVVDSDTVTLLFADGGQAESGESPIEAVSRTYTDYWGRAPIPSPTAWQPWIDTLNQGEGEAAPNGQGFWGGQRARCEMAGFIDKSAFYDIPFRVIGVEGWQVIPQTHPDELAMSTEEICSHDADGDGQPDYPVNEAEWQAEVEAGTSFFNTGENAPAIDETFFEQVGDQGFEIAGYWNFFTTDHGCPDNDPAQCTDDQLGVPLASKQAYAEAFQQDIFVKSSESASDDQTDENGNHVVTTNRGGAASLIDFTNPASFPYWQNQLTRMLDQGITLFMHDFGELTTDAMTFNEGENLQEAHNLYAFEYQRAGREAVDGYFRDRGQTLDGASYHYARAGMTGACAFTPGVFPGDESTTWDKGHGLPSVIPAMLNLSLSGCYAFTTDIGGYFDVTTPRTAEDLFIRWSQLAALTPVMRIHDSTFNGSVFPWTWSEGEELADEDNPQWDTVGIFRRYARLKRKLIPLTEHWAERAAKQGDIGPVRPIILEDLSAQAQSIDYQWLYGEDILVAPVYEEDMTELEVYFPAGARWERVTVTHAGELVGTGEVFEGGATATLPIDSATLAEIPLFLRCGLDNPLVPAVGGAGQCP